MKALRVAIFVSMATTLTCGALAESPKVTAQPITWPREAAKGPVPTFRHRALLGVGGGYLFTSAKVNGDNVAEESEFGGSSGNALVFELGLEERFTRLFSVAGRARFSTANDDWADTVGYVRTRWDFGLEPRLWIRPKAVDDARHNFIPRRVEGYVGVGSGVTLASESPPPRRAYDERIDGRPGYYVSACLGGTLGNHRAALFVELGYVFHSTHVVAALEPRAPGVSRTVEERDYVDHSLLFSIGVVTGFGDLE